MKEYIIKDLLNKSRLVLGVDAEHYPWFAVYRFPNGKFSFTESNYGEYGMGYYPEHCNTIGHETYDEAWYFDLNPQQYPSTVPSYHMIASNCGYLALRKDKVWEIYCLSMDTGQKRMIESASSKDEAFSLLSERIGFEPWNWDNLSEVGTKYTPENIKSLDYNQIFVFGSNLQGRHLGGAAKCAVENFHAVMGQGVGLQGESYAIPTMFNSVEEIRPYVNDFISFAANHPYMKFYVTRIGCNIAGFKEKDIAPLFYDALWHKNIILPKCFVEFIDNNY